MTGNFNHTYIKPPLWWRTRFLTMYDLKKKDMTGLEN